MCLHRVLAGSVWEPQRVEPDIPKYVPTTISQAATKRNTDPKQSQLGTSGRRRIWGRLQLQPIPFADASSCLHPIPKRSSNSPEGSCGTVHLDELVDRHHFAGRGWGGGDHAQVGIYPERCAHPVSARLESSESERGPEANQVRRREEVDARSATRMHPHLFFAGRALLAINTQRAWTQTPRRCRKATLSFSREIIGGLFLS